MSIKLYHGDCTAILKEIRADNPIIVTDPPFNIGYHYNSYEDNMQKDAYYGMLISMMNYAPCVFIHYPEALYELSARGGVAPKKVVSWVYNSNTARQHRDIAFYGVAPNFNQVRQPYKNPNDKRIKQRIADGKIGAKLYDWWNINQVKNVSKDKTAHPCQMPLEVMKNTVGILPANATIIDPFMGSGTTGLACKELGRNFIGIELDEMYYNIAKERLGV